MPDKTDNSTEQQNKLMALSVEGIINLFADIDKKFESLHECSSEDFMEFNSYLKKFHEVSEAISENALKIFDIIAGKDTNNPYEMLKAFQEELNFFNTRFEQQIAYSITSLEKISAIFDQMFIPLKNFNQNLMTLKFMNAQLRFNLTYSDDNQTQTIDNEANKVNLLINRIKTIYPLLDSNLFQLKNSIRSTLFRLKDIKYRTIVNSERILNQTNSSISLLSLKHDNALLQMPTLSERTKKSFDNISKIITNIQYHDIIKQRIEHLQQTLKMSIGQLQQLNEPEINSNSVELKDSYSKMKDISGLQVLQLIHINKQYQQAIKVIIEKYLEISEDMAGISEICHRSVAHTHKPDETLFREIEDKFENAISVIRELDKANKQFNSEIRTIHKTIQSLTDNFKIISDLDDKLKNLLDEIISESNFASLNDVRINDLITQEKGIAAEMNFSINEVITKFEQTLDTSNFMLDKISRYFSGFDFETHSANFLEKAHAILTNLGGNNTQISNLLYQNREYSTGISRQIHASIEQIRYYDFFEKTIEEIILGFNKLNQNIGKNQIDNKEGNIKNIESLYTMDSERLIHKDYTDKIGDVDFFDTDFNADTGDQLGQIELF